MMIRFLMIGGMLALTSSIASMAGAASALSQVKNIDYADLIDRESSLWQTCKRPSCMQTLRMFMKQGVIQDQSSTFCIDRVPARAGSTTTLKVTIVLRKSIFTLTIHDEQGHKCIRGSLSKDGASLDNITAVANLVTGKVLMALWESIWIGCQVPYCRLMDSAKYEGFSLSILLPLVYGTTWYGSMGYFPKYNEQREYADAIALLRACPCDKIMRHFGDDSVVARIIESSCAACELSLKVSFGGLVTTLYKMWRSSDHYQALFKQRLQAVYDHCLVNCPLGVVCSEDIEWRSILTTNMMCIKKNPHQ